MRRQLMVSDHFTDGGKMVLVVQLRPRINRFADADFFDKHQAKSAMPQVLCRGLQ